MVKMKITKVYIPFGASAALVRVSLPGAPSSEKLFLCFLVGKHMVGMEEYVGV